MSYVVTCPRLLTLIVRFELGSSGVAISIHAEFSSVGVPPAEPPGRRTVIVASGNGRTKTILTSSVVPETQLFPLGI